MGELSVVGKSVPRIDALEKVTGKAVYCTDIKLPGMLHARILRSPHPHARIVSIDTSKAAQVPGVRCVVTGKDAPDRRYGLLVWDRTVLARDVVRFVGEPVAAVAAISLDAAEEALGLIEVNYEPLPAIFDAEEAMGRNPPVVLHQDLFHYEKGQLLGGPTFDPDRPNIFHHYKIRRGDTEEGFAKADLVLENRFSTARIQHAALEPHDAVVRPEADGGFTMWVGRQNIWRIRDDIGRLFGIRPTKIRVIQPYVGGGFGGKVATGEELIVFLLALKAEKPVKLVFTREEVFLAGGSREPMIIYIKDGLKKDGALLSREIKCVLKSGAYESNVGLLVRNCSFCNLATYRVPNFKWDSYGVYVNEPPACSFRGFGNTQVVWAIESHMDMIAERLDIDPVELRRKNILQEGETNVVGEVIYSTGARQCLDRMDELINRIGPSEEPEEHKKGTWRKGRGLALCNKHSLAPMSAVARVKVAEDETILVYHGADEIGQGCNTVVAQIAAEEFGVSTDTVKLIFTDTLHTPLFPGGSTSSRVTYNLGNAVRLACQDAKRRLFLSAGKRLEVSPEELETKGGEVYAKGHCNKRIRIAELFLGYRGNRPGRYGSHTDSGEIIGHAIWVQDHAPQDRETGQIDPALAKQGKRVNSSYSYIASGVEAAVNIETGEIKVSWCGICADMGRPINPKMCEQQMEGGMIMGIGDALYEEMLLDNGKLINPNLTDYKIPSFKEVPLVKNVRSMIEAVPHKDGPFGAKGGFGEATMMGIQPAIGNAIYNALGIRLKDLPINPERLLQALEEKGVRS